MPQKTITDKGKMREELLLKPRKYWIIALSIFAALIPSGISFYMLQSNQSNSQNGSLTEAAANASVNSVAALGRLEPQGEVIHLSAASSTEGLKVAKLLVKEGDRVKLGEVVAILDNRDRLRAAQEQAKQQIKVAQANLAKVKAGAKQGEVVAGEATISRLQAQLRGQMSTGQATIARLQAQLEGEKTSRQATIARLQAQLLGENRVQRAKVSRSQAELRNAQAEFARYQKLYEEGAIAASQIDSKRLTVETATQELQEAQAAQGQTIETLQQQINEAQASRKQIVEILQQQINETLAIEKQTIDTLLQQIQEAQGNLSQITEVRPTDVQAAQAEVESAIASAKKAEADVALAYVRAPAAGQILQIQARPGEVVSDRGIVDIGQTSQMYVVAEVYETDISKIRIGQRATVNSLAFDEKLQGVVTQIGSQIEKKNLLDTDPNADLDARVVKVKIRLDTENNQQLANLTNLQVEAIIHVSGKHQNSKFSRPEISLFNPL
ncbi:ABC exporter membrane fusion protein [Nostoc sp.]|uniref:ABC exporter membrane fusion protein n=1 Tax=Nostoc sp. TaxID=1180 RepID=UPI002FFB3272